MTLPPWERPPFTTPDTWRRFTAKVIRTSTCWLWTGALSDGYGMFHDASHQLLDSASSTVRVSRWIWSAYNGPIRASHVILHDCDTPSCCRYEPTVQHLIDGTQSANLQMAADRDRITNGARLGRADLRGQHRQSVAIRTALLTAVRDGEQDPDRLAEILADVIARGDPFSTQGRLF
ncbi:HNH endonuclease [Kitasatospora sp. NPDC059648]|uniref:HNH endonuclease n=1 Tax=Kitasatospora sp. NPDC059648 TaxID=3346894 RepID=UPI00369DF77A